MKPIFKGDNRQDDRDNVRTEMISKEDAERAIERAVKAATAETVNKDAIGKEMISKEDAERMVMRAAEQAAERVLVTRKRKSSSSSSGDGDEDEDSGPVISSKTVKELQNIAGVFNALKEFSANPLQKAIENKVGDVAAGVVERAFSSPPPREKDLVEQILNSQLAAGLGAGLGQRAPELVDKMTNIYGHQKTEQWIDGFISRKGIGNVGGGAGGGAGGEIGSGAGRGQSEVEMVLSLDANNPEHVSAYAQSQGGMSIEIARKVLMIHQDDFIAQLKKGGVDTSQYEIKRGMVAGREMGGETNVQEYKGSSFDRMGRGGERISDDLIVNTPVDEDRRWSERKELVDTETQRAEYKVGNPNSKGNVDNIVGSSDIGKDNVVDSGKESGSISEMFDYLKQLNQYVSGLRDVLEQQNSTITGMQNEIANMKKDKGDIKEEVSEQVKSEEVSEQVKSEEISSNGVTDTTNMEQKDMEQKDMEQKDMGSATVSSINKIKKG